jgi:hypothetical protein
MELGSESCLRFTVQTFKPVGLLGSVLIAYADDMVKSPGHASSSYCFPSFVLSFFEGFKSCISRY